MRCIHGFCIGAVSLLTTQPASPSSWNAQAEATELVREGKGRIEVLCLDDKRLGYGLTVNLKGGFNADIVVGGYVRYIFKM